MTKETTIQDEWIKFRKNYNNGKKYSTIAKSEVIAFTASLLGKRYTIVKCRKHKTR